jgi:hypothetical protein
MNTSTHTPISNTLTMSEVTVHIAHETNVSLVYVSSAYSIEKLARASPLISDILTAVSDQRSITLSVPDLSHAYVLEKLLSDDTDVNTLPIDVVVSVIRKFQLVNIMHTIVTAFLEKGVYDGVTHIADLFLELSGCELWELPDDKWREPVLDWWLSVLQQLYTSIDDKYSQASSIMASIAKNIKNDLLQHLVSKHRDIKQCQDLDAVLVYEWSKHNNTINCDLLEAVNPVLLTMPCRAWWLTFCHHSDLLDMESYYQPDPAAAKGIPKCNYDVLNVKCVKYITKKDILDAERKRIYRDYVIFSQPCLPHIIWSIYSDDPDVLLVLPCMKAVNDKFMSCVVLTGSITVSCGNHKYEQKTEQVAVGMPDMYIMDNEIITDIMDDGDVRESDEIKFEVDLTMRFLI